MTIALPVQANTAWLKGFWLAVSLGIGLLISVLLLIIGPPKWVALGPGVAVGIALPGLLRPQLILTQYKVWNRLVNAYIRYASAFVLLIVFYVMFVAVGRIGSTLVLTPPNGATSMWVPMKSHTRPEHSAAGKGLRNRSSIRGWIWAYRAMASESRNWWTLSLIPFTLLLSALQSEREHASFPESIYTLY